jgi:hypothetical protein
MESGHENIPGLSNTAQLMGFVEHRGSGRSSAEEREAETTAGVRFRAGDVQPRYRSGEKHVFRRLGDVSIS